MKNITYLFNKKLVGISALAIILLSAVFSSCEKDYSGTPAFSTGTPIISKVYILDTIKNHRDSSIVGAEPYKLIAIEGQNIGGALEVHFNGYNTAFNPTYNTDNSLIIRVPSEAPTDNTAENKLRIITSHGEATFDFKIIAKAAVYETDKITFGKNRGNITLKGKNFADVSKVVFSGTTTEISIVAKTKDKVGNETMTLKFPTTTLNQSTIDIINSSGTFTTNSYEFVNADNAFVIFDEDFAKDFANNSWGDPLIISKDQKYAGETSLAKTFAGGNWHLAAFSNWWPSVEYNANYKYITFAIKGGSVPLSLWIQSDASKIGFGNFDDKNKIDVAANVWNYYKIPVKDLDFWYPGTILKQLGWRVKGPDKTETLYFDDVMFIK